MAQGGGLKEGRATMLADIEAALVKEDAALFELMKAMRAVGEKWTPIAPKMQTLREARHNG